VALLELAVRDDHGILKLNIVDEKQYELASRADMSDLDLKILKEREQDYRL
jgi:hypothetical protein